MAHWGDFEFGEADVTEQSVLFKGEPREQQQEKTKVNPNPAESEEEEEDSSSTNFTPDVQIGDGV